MDRDRFARLVAIYEQVEILRRARDDETDAVSKMSALAFPMRLTPELRTQMIESVYRVDRSRFTFAFIGAADLADDMRELGWDDTAAIDRRIREDAAHQMRGDTEKMMAAFKVDMVLRDQAHVSFMHQFGGAQRLGAVLAAQCFQTANSCSV